MLTVITSKDNHTDAEFDLRFGRGAWFCLYNEESKAIEFIPNEHKDSNTGAGTKAAEKMVSLGVKKVISGDFGPKAKEMLERFKIQMVILEDDQQSVQEILNKLK